MMAQNLAVAPVVQGFKLEDLALRLADELRIIVVSEREPYGDCELSVSGENRLYSFHYFADQMDEDGRQLESIAVRKASDEHRKISLSYMGHIGDEIILNLFFHDAELAKYAAFISRTRPINDIDCRFMDSISLGITRDFKNYRESVDGSIHSVSYGVILREEEFHQVNADLISKYLGV